MTLLIIILLILALGGGGYGFRSGWYGGSRAGGRGFNGLGLLPIILIVVVVILLFRGAGGP